MIRETPVLEPFVVLCRKSNALCRIQMSGSSVFEVYVSKKALKGLKELSQEYRAKVLELLEEFKKNPLPDNYDVKKLKGFENAYRIRVGKYRVVYKVDWDERKVFVVFIGHRGKAY